MTATASFNIHNSPAPLVPNAPRTDPLDSDALSRSAPDPYEEAARRRQEKEKGERTK